MNHPDHIAESLETIFWVKILKFFDADPGSGLEKIQIRDKHPGSTIPKLQLKTLQVLGVTILLNHRTQRRYLYSTLTDLFLEVLPLEMLGVFLEHGLVHGHAIRPVLSNKSNSSNSSTFFFFLGGEVLIYFLLPDEIVWVKQKVAPTCLAEDKSCFSIQVRRCWLICFSERDNSERCFFTILTYLCSFKIGI